MRKRKEEIFTINKYSASIEKNSNFFIYTKNFLWPLIVKSMIKRSDKEIFFYDKCFENVNT